MTTREILQKRIAELKEQLADAEHYGAVISVDSARIRINEVESLLDLLNEEHADGAATVPVANECAQQDLREAEAIAQDEFQSYNREKGRF